MSADSLTANLIADLRGRLLDLRNSNPLLSYKHSERSKRQIRIVAEQPDFLHECLTTAEELSFRPLPEPEGELPDEKGDRFLMALEEARRLDPAWAALAEKEEDISSDRLRRLDRQIRDRVRAELGLPAAKGGKLTSIAEWARMNGIEPSFDLPLAEDGDTGRKQHDNGIQTLLLPDQMQGKLAGLLDHARTALQETGVNVLHVATGFLEWYEATAAAKPMLAPLLLYPVDIERKPMKGKGQYRYFIRGEQDPIINITLRQRLAKDYNLIVPEFEEGDTAETYMARMAKVIADLPSWRVRRFATVGVFSFSRLVMYNDLDPSRWGKDENSLPASGVLSDLFGRKEAGDRIAETYDLEDPAVEAEVPLLIRDADSSQHQAIIDVMRGRNLVIKGPPGTGKSQTIANIIAASLAKKRTVLFVAEKAAALDVVKKRLDEAGLGDFCFEVHSTKSKKAEVLAGMERRLNIKAASTRTSVEAALGELQSLRERLAQHATTMIQPFGALEIADRGTWRRVTIHDVLWAEQRTRARAPRFIGLDRVVLLNAMETTRFDADRRRDRLAAIERLVDGVIRDYGRVEDHPWSFITRPDIQVLDVPNIVDSAHRIQAELDGLAVQAGKLEELGFTGPGELDRLHTFSTTLSLLPEPDPTVDDGVLKALITLPAAHAELGRVAGLLEEHRLLESERHHRLIEGAKVPVPSEVDELYRRASDVGLADHQLGAIAQRAKVIQEELNSWNKLVALAENLMDQMGLRGGTTPRVLRRAIGAVDLLVAADRPALLARCPSVVDEMARPVLDKADAQLRALRERDATLRERFVVDASISIVEVRRHAGLLRTTGFFAKLGSEFKNAKKIATAMLKGGEAIAEARLADMLVELAEHLEERQAFEGDQSLRATCAHRFAGIDTDLRALIAANQFAIEVRSTFAGMGEPEKSIRRFLLDADVETLDGLKALASDERFAQLRQATLAESAPDIDLIERRTALERTAKELGDIVSGFLAAGFRPNITPAQAEELSSLVARLSDIDAAIMNSRGAEFLGAIWIGLETNPILVRAAIRASEVLRTNAPDGTLAAFTAPCRATVETVRMARGLGATLVECTRHAKASLKDMLKRVIEERLVDIEVARYSGRLITDLSDMFGRSAGARNDLMVWVTLRRGISDARADGLGPILDAYDEAREPYLGLRDAYDRVFYRSLARRVLEINPALGESSALPLDDIRTRFRDIDQRIMEMRRQALISALATVPIPQGIQSPRKGECTEATLIQNEIAKKKKHIPIRDLIERAANAIRAMKPCTMMSPASVARFLKPGQSFDLLVIDEASQMRPEEAISALARARQAVIVGDPQQLPPTNIFERQDSDDDEADNEIEKVAAESILDVARTACQPLRELLWHFRSRHGSLIAFSNRHFYDNRLIVFPSPQEGHPDYGVSFVPITGQYRASVNVPEAQAVAHAAVAFMAKNPDKSLGIVALNQPQRDLILSEMDRLFIRDNIAERYRARWQTTLEPFFVKNLENVQGDERDVIFISTVYGPDENGNLMQRFAMINGAAGDRRLNVLFSRAKHGITVFSSMRPDQIRVDASSPRGTRLLKDYLAFAATGRLDHGLTPYKECDSDFERFVKERLEIRGYELVAQVGVAGFWIDLGVRHCNWPYGFLLGIECDGAAYHSSLSARDRDRLRQQILESLGWTIYRVWSTDWFRDQDRELAKMVDFIERTLADRLKQRAEMEAQQAAFVEEAAAEEPDEEESQVPSAEEDGEDEDDGTDTPELGMQTLFDLTHGAPEATTPTITNVGRSAVPALAIYVDATFDDLDIEISRDRFFEPEYKPIIAKLVERCITVEGPIRDDVLARRIGSLHGFQKAGSRIREYITSIARGAYKATREGSDIYFWPTGSDPTNWNTFRRHKREVRPVDEIALAELQSLALLAMADQRSATEDILLVMARIAGLQRLRAPSRERLTLAHRKALALAVSPPSEQT